MNQIAPNEDLNLRNVFSKRTYINILRLLICRLIFLVLGIYYMILVSCVKDDTSYYSFIIFSIIIIIDTCFIGFKRKGIDFKW